MKSKAFLIVMLCVVALFFYACNRNKNKSGSKKKPTILTGLYSFGPEKKAFAACEDSCVYWVIDSASLEPLYTDLGFKKPYTPVYVEVEGYLIKSDTAVVRDYYDSTLVVTKVLKIMKNIPEDPCWQ